MKELRSVFKNPKDLFSSRGKAGRFQFWVLIILTGLVDTFAWRVFGDEHLSIIGTPILIISIWIGWAVMVKRCHDVDRSGWFLLWSFLPVIGSLLVVLFLGIKKPEKLPN